MVGVEADSRISNISTCSSALISAAIHGSMRSISGSVRGSQSLASRWTCSTCRAPSRTR